MNPAAKIALRYVRKKNSVQAINIISYISMIAVAVLAASMIILLSVFNGFEQLLQSLYHSFYPDVKISAAKGKWITLDENQISKIGKLEGVAYLSKVAEDMTLIIAQDHQRVAILKGVDDNWYNDDRLGDLANEDITSLKGFDTENNPAIIGSGIAADLGINVHNPTVNLDIYYPREESTALSLEQSLNSISLRPIASFTAQQEFDGRYMIVPMQTADNLFQLNGKLSSLEVHLKDERKTSSVISQIKKILGTSYKIEDKYEQNKTIYMVMRSERLAIYVILTFILIIASFTLVGVLSMLALDKRKDMSILRAMGAKDGLIRNVFLSVGIFQSIIGCLIGLTIGILICYGQKIFGWIKLGDGFIIDTYPVAVDYKDVLIVFIIVLIISFLGSLIPAYKAAKQDLVLREE